ncbi:MAG TPA: tripartite tricarboxylate transporter substrate binding protein [Quisquiliibacterium sp.]|nr:tripartite tricarboxylate transporter substrate binding protein [Quisquiliibacterium sp.]HQD83863.1 tripartite tricarboxylate transporter substrate binding protein [Quisquiliibacterium sp.]HQN11333.1 tripartite tricarboxylate transporter substrate binding protein [Quisquiliibacterium sp.]HQP65583.1 tripartite tricarboxylate transporter substrate binding protein [Quisquiliibacterium sp.]
MNLFKSALAATVLALAAGTAAAQSYPNKPIRWIVPYTPGGITDNVTRMVTGKMQASLGQTIVVENKPGANSIIGVDLTAKAPADGYTIVTVIAAHAANATLYQGRLPFDPVKSLVPVSLAAVAPLILTANNAFPAKDVRELIAYAKANPGKVSFGSSGVGAAAHLTTELLKQTAGIDMTHVPYKGTAPALTDLQAGNIQILIDVPSTMMPHVRGGKVKALAMFSEKRLPSVPEVPTMAEAGGPPLLASTWVMFLAPAGTPREIVNKLSQAVSDAVKSPEVSGKLNDLGIIPVGNTSDQAAKFLADEIAQWGRVISTAGVKAD